MKLTRLEPETNRLTAIRQFYTHQLNLPLIQHSARSVTFQLRWSELVFQQTDQPVAPYHFAINIPLYSLEQYGLWYDVPYIPTM